MRGELIYLLVYLIPILVFVSGTVSLILWRKNLVLIIISLELCFIASGVGFTLSSVLLDDAAGMVLTMFGLTLAGAEVSLGLAIAIVVYRRFDSIFLKSMKKLKS